LDIALRQNSGEDSFHRYVRFAAWALTQPLSIRDLPAQFGLDDQDQLKKRNNRQSMQQQAELLPKGVSLRQRCVTVGSRRR